MRLPLPAQLTPSSKPGTFRGDDPALVDALIDASCRKGNVNALPQGSFGRELVPAMNTGFFPPETTTTR